MVHPEGTIVGMPCKDHNVRGEDTNNAFSPRGGRSFAATTNFLSTILSSSAGLALWNTRLQSSEGELVVVRVSAFCGLSFHVCTKSREVCRIVFS